MIHKIKQGRPSAVSCPCTLIKMVDMSELLELLATKFNRFLFDNFCSTENLNAAETGTAEISSSIFELKLNSGVLASSTAKAYYNLNLFNPVYSNLYMRFYLNSMADCKVFLGFKESTDDVDWADAVQVKESSVGLMVENGKLYAYSSRMTAAGPPAVYSQQKTEISGIDVTKDFIYKIINEKFFTQPLPQVIPYFDDFRIITPNRIWTQRASNGTYPPEDKVHYLVFCIENTTGAEKILRIKNITYGEEYAD